MSNVNEMKCDCCGLQTGNSETCHQCEVDCEDGDCSVTGKPSLYAEFAERAENDRIDELVAQHVAEMEN